MMFGKNSENNDDERDGIAIILGGGKSKPKDEGIEARKEAKHMASRAMMKAGKMGDTEAFTDALLDFLRACGLIDDEGEYKKNSDKYE